MPAIKRRAAVGSLLEFSRALWARHGRVPCARAWPALGGSLLSAQRSAVPAPTPISEPEPYLGGWRCGNEPRPASQWRGANVPRYCSEEYDRLLGEMAKTGDLGERARLAKAMNDMLVQDHVLIPLVHRARVSAHAHSLGGVLLNTWDSEIWNIADWHRIR